MDDLKCEQIPELSEMCHKLLAEFRSGTITEAVFNQEICYISLQEKYGFSELRWKPNPTPEGKKLMEYVKLPNRMARIEFLQKYPKLFDGPKNSKWLSSCGKIEHLNYRNLGHLEFMLNSLAGDQKAVSKITAMMGSYPKNVKDLPPSVQRAIDTFGGTLVAEDFDE